MQNTRLTTLFNRVAQDLNQWAKMPWRRLSLIIISLLLGNFIASVISTTTGQRANLDVIIAFWLTILIELLSWLAYSRLIRVRQRIGYAEAATTRLRRPLWLDLINGVKIGFIYGLFLEAFKLGS